MCNLLHSSLWGGYGKYICSHVLLAGRVHRVAQKTPYKKLMPFMLAGGYVAFGDSRSFGWGPALHLLQFCSGASWA